MSIKATAQVAAATAAVLVGALCIPGVAYASDHHSHHHGSYASDRDHDGDNGDDGDKKDHDSKAEIAGIDLGQVTDAVSDLLNSLGDIL
ncbi:MAG TPA: hypothetical protein VH141_06650 [Pseudonocardia sp.]|nr:hypothetical protein [Pseudonocardia sp.]